MRLLLGLVALGIGLGLIGCAGQGIGESCSVTLPPGESIQSTIDEANKDAVICLEAGTWNATVRIDRSVTLRGARARETVVSGIEVGESAQVTLAHISIARNDSEGLVVRDAAHVEISDIIVLNNGGCGIFVTSARAQIDGDTTEVSGNGVALCGFAPARLRTPLVEPTDEHQLSVPTDYPTLQHAVDAVAPGGIVHVQTGTYEPGPRAGLTVTKAVTIRGAGSGQSILTQLGRQRPLVSVTAEAEDVTFQDLTFDNAQGVGIRVFGQATFEDIQVGNTRNRAIINGHISASRSVIPSTGLGIGGTADVSVIDSAVSEKLTGLAIGDSAHLSLIDTAVSDGHIGVVAMDSARVSLTQAVVSSNEEGVLASGSSKLTVINSRIDDSGTMTQPSYGLKLKDAAEASLIGTSISDTGWGAGLVVSDSSRAKLNRSTISKSGRPYDHGVLDVRGVLAMDSAYLRLTDSAVSNHRDDGLMARGSAQVVIQESRIWENGNWGVVAHLAKCKFSENDFQGQVLFQGNNTIRDNNASGELDGIGNPGDHSFQDRPDGQVCLP